MPLTFSQRVLRLALSVPLGRVTTYGRIARAAGGGGMAAQSITSILGKAVEAGVASSGRAKAQAKNIPFHRIVYANGRVWLPTVAKRRRLRLALYRREGIEISANERVVDFAAKAW